MKRFVLALGLSLCLAPLPAREPLPPGGIAPPPPPPPAPLPTGPESPDLPPVIESGQVLEPEITIIRTERETIEEYRVGGRLYKVRIIPHAGPPYYLLDTDGDGQLDALRHDDLHNIAIPQWLIYSW